MNDPALSLLLPCIRNAAKVRFCQSHSGCSILVPLKCEESLDGSYHKDTSSPVRGCELSSREASDSGQGLKVHCEWGCADWGYIQV